MLGLEEEDDIVAADLDMHSLILTSNPQDQAVIFFWTLFPYYNISPPFLNPNFQD
jgi:hypothetical protein